MILVTPHILSRMSAWPLYAPPWYSPQAVDSATPLIDCLRLSDRMPTLLGVPTSLSSYSLLRNVPNSAKGEKQ